MKRGKAGKSLMKSLQWHISPYSSLEIDTFLIFLHLVAFKVFFLLSVFTVSYLKRLEDKAMNNRYLNESGVFFLPGISASVI